MARFEVHVVSRASRPGPDGRHGGLPRLRVAAAPEDGRANAEAEKTLAKLLDASVTLVGGARSRRKMFETDLSEPALRAQLTEVFG